MGWDPALVQALYELKFTRNHANVGAFDPALHPASFDGPAVRLHRLPIAPALSAHHAARAVARLAPARVH